MHVFRPSSVRCGLLAALVLALVASPVGAWNSAGHRIVANLAYDRLEPELRAKVVKLMKGWEQFDVEFASDMPDEIQTGTDADRDRWIFLQCSIWPDLVRDNPKYHIDKWHYINDPYFLDDDSKDALKNKKGIFPSLDLPDPVPEGDAKELNAVQALKLCLQRLGEAGTKDADKAKYICWVMHIVGDLHQPLHSTALYSRGRFNHLSGDHGGNSISTKQKGNLHKLWDGLLGSNSLTLNGVRGASQSILEIAEMKKAGEDAAKLLDPADYVKEGRLLCEKHVYDKLILDEVRNKEDQGGHLAKVDLPLAYLKKAGLIARLRAIQGGYRLAEILKKSVN